MGTVRRWLRARPAAGERAAGLVEYALLVALVAVVCVAAVTMVGEETDGGVKRAGDSLTDPAPSETSCDSIRAGAYATGPEHPFQCWDPATNSGFLPR